MTSSLLRILRSWACPDAGDRFVWITEVADADLSIATPGWSPPPDAPRLTTASDDGVARWRLLLDLRVVGVSRRAAGAGR